MSPTTRTRRATVDYLTDDQRWGAVAGRDPRAVGAFVYAVRTTGVFCRPTCPSRLPNRSNVGFFSTASEALGAGYRACKKCEPTSATIDAPEAVLQACRLIDAADEPPSLTELAGAVGLSSFHFHRLFKQTIGLTPKAYAAARRAERFRDGLRNGRSVTAALYESGFGASSRCYETVGEDLGMTPTEYKKGAIGKRLRWAVAPCSLGYVVVAATDRGVSLIELGDDPEELRARAWSRFPNATFEDGGDEFQACVELVVAVVENPGRVCDLPLDVQGTAFQHQVWKALAAIPPGTTASYADVARTIGRPDAPRAVAAACAANKLAVVVPCHRVVRADGGISGYRWGVDRKRELLKREAEGDDA